MKEIKGLQEAWAEIKSCPKRRDCYYEVFYNKETGEVSSNFQRRRFNASFETEDGGGWGVGPRPNYDFDAAYKKYPQAHAYLIAEREAYKDNYELAEIGRKALEKGINGQWEEAMDDLKREEDEFTDRHAWD